MIQLSEYFHDSVVNFGYIPTDEDNARASDLLTKVNALFPDCTLRSGHRTREKTLALIAAGYRASLGGKHEQCYAVDIADPDDQLDANLDDTILADAGLYREAPHATVSWCHLQTVAPKSGHRTFEP